MYRYRAVNREGQEVSGSVEAGSEREASRLLDAQGLLLVDLRGEQAVGRRLLQSSKASQRELLLIMQEFITLLESGVALVTALSSLARSSHHPQLVTAFADMSRQVRRGDGFSAAFRASGLPLPAYFQQLTEAGEATGRLAEALRNGVEQFEYDQRVRSEIRAALVYPVVLILTGIGAVGIIFMWVVPRFGGLLTQRGQDMPDLARWVIGSGVWLNANAGLVLIGAAALLAGVIALARRPGMFSRLNEWLASMPVIGTWIIESEVGRWAGTLGTLLNSRVELTRALELSSGAVSLDFLRGRLKLVGRSVKGGATLSGALREHRALNPTGYDLVAVGEASGELPKLLKALARLYETTGRDRMRRVLQLIEPFAIILMGAIIGTIVIAIILAITSVHDIPL